MDDGDPAPWRDRGSACQAASSSLATRKAMLVACYSVALRQISVLYPGPTAFPSTAAVLAERAHQLLPPARPASPPPSFPMLVFVPVRLSLRLATALAGLPTKSTETHTRLSSLARHGVGQPARPHRPCVPTASPRHAEVRQRRHQTAQRLRPDRAPVAQCPFPKHGSFALNVGHVLPLEASTGGGTVARRVVHRSDLRARVRGCSLARLGAAARQGRRGWIIHRTAQGTHRLRYGWPASGTAAMVVWPVFPRVLPHFGPYLASRIRLQFWVLLSIMVVRDPRPCCHLRRRWVCILVELIVRGR